METERNLILLRNT